jgi:predicted esterase
MVHQGQPIIQAGVALEKAARLVILLHGRGATAESMLGLYESLETEDSCFWIPQAAGNRWYPETAFGPLEPNEPDLSSALALVSDLIDQATAAGISRQEVLLGGFSQGACLAAEYTVRYPDLYRGLFVLSGALIGPPGLPRELKGNLRGTPVFLGIGDRDPWVALDVFEEAGQIFTVLDAAVDKRIYPGMGHTINQEEIQVIRKMIASG